MRVLYEVCSSFLVGCVGIALIAIHGFARCSNARARVAKGMGNALRVYPEIMHKYAYGISMASSSI